MDKKKRKKNVAKKLEERRKRLLKERDKENKKTAIYNKWPNGKLIYDCMVDSGYKGDIRDYMILTGSRMVDYRGSYGMVAKDGATIGVGGKTVIVHKGKLKNVIGEEAAKKFWHPCFGRLIDVKEGTKSKK